MTTIAYRDGVLAGDTLVKRGDERVGQALKVARIGTWLVGYSGSLRSVQAYHTALQHLHGQRKEPWKFQGLRGQLFPSDTEAILVCPETGIWNLCFESFGVVRIPGKFEAIGSGATYAMGALEMGASAVDAVRVASKFDVSTSGLCWVSFGGQNESS